MKMTYDSKVAEAIVGEGDTVICTIKSTPDKCGLHMLCDDCAYGRYIKLTAERV